MRFFLLLFICTAGCGPLDAPMPQRLDQESQATIDRAWQAALTPVDKNDRQQWLDALICSHAYQIGVDRLGFRSEKDYDGGRVVLEVCFDRSKPDEDRFEMTILDRAGNSIRQEKFTRSEVELTSRDFFPANPEAPPRPDIEKRIKHVQEMIPTTKK